MKKTKIIMGMPITVELIGKSKVKDIETVFGYFNQIDKRFSTYKLNSEICKVNKNLPKNQWSSEMKIILKLCDQTRKQTGGFFNIKNGNQLDPSGLVKGWAINNAAKILASKGYKNFYIEAGGDIQAQGHNEKNKPWEVGIRNPFNISEIIKVLKISGQGVATSGTYIRGQHIYNPFDPKPPASILKSLTVIGPDIYEADRFATAAFAMGLAGAAFIEQLSGFEAYMIDSKGLATLTSGFDAYVDSSS